MICLSSMQALRLLCTCRLAWRCCLDLYLSQPCGYACVSEFLVWPGGCLVCLILEDFMPDFFALLGDSSNGQTPQQCIWVVKIAPACVACFSDWGVFCRANRLRAVQQPAAEKAAVWDGGQCAGERAAAGSSWSWWDCCWFERGSQLQQRSGGSSSNSSKP